MSLFQNTYMNSIMIRYVTSSIKYQRKRVHRYNRKKQSQLQGTMLDQTVNEILVTIINSINVSVTIIIVPQNVAQVQDLA